MYYTEYWFIFPTCCSRKSDRKKKIKLFFPIYASLLLWSDLKNNISIYNRLASEGGNVSKCLNRDIWRHFGDIFFSSQTLFPHTLTGVFQKNVPISPLFAKRSQRSDRNLQRGESVHPWWCWYAVGGHFTLAFW